MTGAVETRNLCKKYLIAREKNALIRYLLPGYLGIRNYEEFWALRDINLDIENGECVGIIGRNGAGKSSLLKILAGITFPSEGSVKTKGKVSAILGLGEGFHPDLTGRENIFLNAAILGLDKNQVRKKFSAIVEFSELGDFIELPLKVYSTGMCMRLGFAVAIHVDFDILLIDEILAVGDIAFQRKCLDKLKQFRILGKTLIMASQSTYLLKEFSQRMMILDKGRVSFAGSPEKVIEQYTEMMSVGENDLKQDAGLIFQEAIAVDNLSNPELEKETPKSKDGWGTITGNRDLEITKIRILNSRNQGQLSFRTGQPLKVRVDFIAHGEIADPHFGIAIFKEDGTYCYGPNTRFDGIKIPKIKPGRGWFCIEYRELNLLPGNYKISVAIWEKDEKFAYAYHNAYYDFRVYFHKKDQGLAYLSHRWKYKLP